MEAWFLAAQSGDVQTLEKLGARFFKAQDASGETALIAATKRGALEAVKFLVPKEQGLVDSKRQCALFYAPSVEIARCLAGEADTYNSVGDFPLHHFAYTNNVALVELFADRCKQQNIDGRTPLHFAAQAGYYECCVLLSSASGIKDYNGQYALLGAVCGGYLEIVELLKREVDAAALRFACMQDHDALRVLAAEAENQGLVGGLDNFTKQQVFEALGSAVWKPVEEGTRDEEFESIKLQLQEAERRRREIESDVFPQEDADQ